MYKIRKANINDALKITEISIDTWKKAYNGILPKALIENRKVNEKRINNWKENISNPKYTVLVCEENQICAYLWGGPKRDNIEVPYEIYALYVSSEHQKKGIGKDLIKEFKKLINNQPFYLYMLKGNEPASIFYKKQGGVENTKFDRTLPVGNYTIEEEIYIFQQP